MGIDSPRRTVDQPDEPYRRADDWISDADRERLERWAASAEEFRRRGIADDDDHDPIPSISEIGDETDPDGSWRDGFVDKVAEGVVTDTAKAFGMRLVEVAADLQGWGLALRAAQFAVKMVEWSQVAEGDGGVDVSVAFPLSTGVDVELSVHLADGQDGPPLTVCCAPSDGWAVGVAQIGPFDVSPSTGPAHSERKHAGEVDVAHPDSAAEADRARFSDEDFGVLGDEIEIISADLSTREIGPREGLAAVEHAALQELPPLRAWLRRRGTRIALLIDLKAGRLISLRLDEDGDILLPTWRIRIEVDPDGRLRKADVRPTGFLRP